ncbi:MAG: Ni/Fe hydrogenase subunit alpha [Actinomycetes bacterium]|jgi:coenzyme F420-reducing hydrogenase alpha subunit|nr:Ni/Fe hydrogenase subunit alpha [Actinomycetes bacterium]
MTKLNIHHIARIEGHGNVAVEVKNGRLTKVQMQAIEPARFFEAMVKGRTIDEVPIIVSRICGICSPNHTVTSIQALEDAIGLSVSRRTEQLRYLLVYGSYLCNHASHLYLLSGPDFLGLPSVFPLAETAPEVVSRALSLKKLGNDVITAVGGRPVHPVSAVVGGFTDEPSRNHLRRLAARLRAAVREAAATVELFASFDIPEYEPEHEMLALKSEGTYAITRGEVAALRAGWTRPARDYHEFIHETPVASGNAKFSQTDGAPFMAAAIARVNINWAELTPSARVAAAGAGLRAVVRNPFLNNLCQAIEMVDACERCAALCEELAESDGDSKPRDWTVAKAAGGAGATEAPRGTLYHSYRVSKAGKVTAGDVITPTAQNLACLEADLHAFAARITDADPEEFKLRIEQLVRAYDPCLSCAVH